MLRGHDRNLKDGEMTFQREVDSVDTGTEQLCIEPVINSSTIFTQKYEDWLHVRYHRRCSGDYQTTESYSLVFFFLY